MFTNFCCIKRKKIRPNFKLNDSVGTADLKQAFSKGDTTNWSIKLYKITENVNDTKSSYCIDNLPELHNEALPNISEMTLQEKKMF